MSDGRHPTATLSLVVVSFNEVDLLDRCLSSVSQQEDCEPIEVLVVRDANRFTDNDAQQLRTDYRQFKWLEAPSGSTVPLMRTVGIKESSGEIVALIEDDCVIPPSWSRDLRAAHNSDYQAIGGAVEPDEFRRGLDWAIFFCEYGRFMPPFAGTVDALPGNNLSYKRETLQLLLNSGAIGNGFYEVFVNSSLQQSGHQLYAHSKLLVRNVNCWRLANATTVPFNHGRGFAAMRFARRSAWLRLPYLGIAMLLPALQTLRVCRQVVSRKRYLGRLIQALPAIILFWTSWSVGEFMGYLLGPGRSLEHWR